jgi:uncharacterized protein with GYD domain
LPFLPIPIRAFGISSSRRSAPKPFRQNAEAAGIKVLAQLWTAGTCDGLLILQSDNEEKVLGTLASLASQGNVRTQSLRAFDAAEFAAIVGA